VTKLRKWRSVLGLGSLLLAAGAPATLSGCGDVAVTLPADYNVGRFRRFVIKAPELEAGRTQFVFPLNGMHGSPKPIIAADADLKTKLWGRLQGVTEPDGAHVRMVSVGSDVLCDLSLEGIFPTATGDPGAPNAYKFSTLDQHMQAAMELNTASILWVAAFNPAKPCTTSTDGSGTQLGASFSQADADRWAEVAFNTLRHLRGDPRAQGQWDPNEKNFYRLTHVQFLDDPIGRMGLTRTAPDLNTGAWGQLFGVYREFALDLKAADTGWPDTTNSEGATVKAVNIGGMGFLFTTKVDLEYTSSADKHAALRFIDFVAENAVPLDFLSFRTKTATPHQAFLIAKGLRSYLDTKGLQTTELMQVGMEADYASPTLDGLPILTDAAFKSAHLGAFQTAIRVYGQDVPLNWALAGRGPRVYSDLKPHIGENVPSLLIESDYFCQPGDLSCGDRAAGTAKPAYLPIFPFRQVAGHQRVKVTSGADEVGLTLMASHDKNNPKVLHVIIANANVQEDAAAITYDLRLETFAPVVKSVEYKLAVLDRNAWGTGAFVFSDNDILEPTGPGGDVRFVHEMAVPSVHYIQFVKP
jgi:hypothetical protein